jgi:hypothetical protein
MNKTDANKISKVCGLIGFVSGLLITSLNIIKPNNFLLIIGPVLIFSSLTYLFYGDRFKLDKALIFTSMNKKYLQVTNILYWLLISTVLLINHNLSIYQRPIIIFIFTSIGVVLLGIEILASDNSDNYSLIIFKILLLSIILRATGYFISSYPVGSDPWAHAEYVKNYINYAHIFVDKYPPGTGLQGHYLPFPISHILACSLKLILNLNLFSIAFIISSILVFSTIYIFLIANKLTNNPKISLLSMLLVNFVDHHIQWSIQVIAMSFGLALFTIFVYLVIKEQGKNNIILKSTVLLFIFLMILTHTITAFIAMIFLLCINVCLSKSRKQIVGLNIFIIFVVLLLFQWLNANYPFLQIVVIQLKKSLLSEVTFITKANPFKWQQLIGSIGFINYFFFACIGFYNGINSRNEKIISCTIGCISLVSIILLFMALGLRNIEPARWWAFIYIILSIFSCIGLFCILNLFKNNMLKILFVSLFLAVSSFFMITNNVSNVDSIIYSHCFKLSWSQSEMTLFSNINKKYDGIIISDAQTAIRPFNTYFKRYNSIPYPLTEKGDLNWDEMQKGMVIWTHDSLYKKVQIFRGGNIDILGHEYEMYLNKHYHCIEDTYGARSYLGLYAND